MNNNTTIIMPENLQEKEIVKFNVTDAAIAEMQQNYMALKISDIDDKNGFKVVYNARQIVKNKRILVEKTRKELIAPYKNNIEIINGEAKRITELLTPIEDYLESEEKRIDQERERLKREAEEREQQRIRQRIDRLTQYGYGVDYAEIKSMTDIAFNDLVKKAEIEFEKDQQAKAEAARLEQEEKERLRKEREELEKQKRELEYEKNILAAEKKTIEQKKQKEQQIQFDKVLDDDKPVEQNKPNKVEADMVLSFVESLSKIYYPEMYTTQGKKLIKETKLQIEGIQNYLLKQSQLFNVFTAEYDK